MAQPPTLHSRSELVVQAVRRLLTYTDQVTYFGANSTVQAIADTLGAQASQAYRLYKALTRRTTLLGSSGDSLDEVAGERGAARRPAQRARLLVIVVPWSTPVTSITVGLTTAIEVEESRRFTAGDSIRIRNGDGSLTEKVDVIAITTGTGPTGGDEVIVSSLTNTYDPANDNVEILLRQTLGLETEIATAAGVGFHTTATISVGDANPVLSGEGAALALADKVWCEAVVAGAVGNIPPRSLRGFAIANPKIRRVYNPERAFGGFDEESDADLRYRAAHRPSALAQETAAWFEALAVESGPDVLRGVIVEADSVATLKMKLLASNGGALNEKRLRAVENYVAARVRSYCGVVCDNVDLRAIEVEAQVKLDPDVTLRQAWLDAGARVANYLDFRRWTFGQTIDWLEILRLVKNSRGVRSVLESSFLPSADVTLEPDQLPVFVRLSLQDAETFKVINGALAVSFDDTTEV